MLANCKNLLGLRAKIDERISDPTFAQTGALWRKGVRIPPPESAMVPHTHSFVKYGRALGLQKKRYAEYEGGVLYYYEKENDHSPQGFCPIENLYLTFFQNGECYMLYLTNGSDYLEMHFRGGSFLKKHQASFFQYAVQLDFDKKYSLVRKLGKGTFATVYQAQHRRKNTVVAAKFIGKTDAQGIETKSLVQEEKTIMLRAGSARLCRMLEFFETDNHYVLVMEDLGGQDLTQALRKDPGMKINSAVKIVRQCLQGLDCLHRLRIIHRDLKPQNIMVSQDYSIKIIDFGLSLQLLPQQHAKVFKRCGTVGFMAPEVISNMPLSRKPYDQKADMFSMGLILHVILMGNNPLQGVNYSDTCRKNQYMEYSLDAHEIVRRYGQHALQLMEGLLEKDPKKRLSASEALQSPFLLDRQEEENTQMETITESELSHSASQEGQVIEPKPDCLPVF